MANWVDVKLTGDIVPFAVHPIDRQMFSKQSTEWFDKNLWQLY